MLLDLHDIQQAGDSQDLFRGRVGSKSVAVKVYRWNCNGETRRNKRKLLEDEISAFAMLSCDGVAPILGFCFETQGIMQQLPGVVTSWMHNGNILDFFEAFPYVDRVTMLGDVANHLEQLHSIGIVHGNLHPRNILVDESGSPLLADFRLQATTLDAQFNNKENGYNVRYCSPEEIISPLGGALHAASDVYSFACTCLEILTSVSPFAELTSSMDIALALHSGQSPYNMSSCRVRENVTLACNPPLRKVLENSLHSNAARRPRMSTILKAFSILGGSIESKRMSEQMETEPWIANAMLGRSFGSVTRKCKL